MEQYIKTDLLEGLKSKSEDYMVSEQKLLKECDCFLDTCSIMNNGFTSFVLRNVDFMRENNLQFHLLQGCYQELEANSRNPIKDPITRYQARRGKKLCDQLRSENLMVYRQLQGDSPEMEDHFADHTFSLLLHQLSGDSQRSCCLITNDEGLQNLCQKSIKTYETDGGTHVSLAVVWIQNVRLPDGEFEYRLTPIL